MNWGNFAIGFAFGALATLVPASWAASKMLGEWVKDLRLYNALTGYVCEHDPEKKSEAGKKYLALVNEDAA